MDNQRRTRRRGGNNTKSKSKTQSNKTSSSDTPGRVFVASMNLKKPGKRPVCGLSEDEFVSLNVTSAQAKDGKNRLAFSPMTEVPGGFDPTNPNGERKDKYHCFENWWQSLKAIEGIDFEKATQKWKKFEEPHRRFPGSKDKKKLYSLYNGRQYGYIDSRKDIYVPQYHKYILSREISRDQLAYYRNQLKEGKNVIVYDFDGPRTEDGGTTCLEVSEAMLNAKINDPVFPFGHCFVVAAELAGIPLSKYVSSSKSSKSSGKSIKSIKSKKSEVIDLVTPPKVIDLVTPPN